MFQLRINLLYFLNLNIFSEFTIILKLHQESHDVLITTRLYRHHTNTKNYFNSEHTLLIRYMNNTNLQSLSFSHILVHTGIVIVLRKICKYSYLIVEMYRTNFLSDLYQSLCNQLTLKDINN